MSSNAIESSGVALWLRERNFTRRMLRSHAAHEIFVVSVPKSGRTWHRVMLGHYLTRLVGRDTREALKLDLLCASAKIPSVLYTHNGSCFTDKLPPTSKIVGSPMEWQNKSVLLLTRDIRDVLVSAYFHIRYREKTFDGPISDFVRHPFVGAIKMLHAQNRWHQQRNRAARFEVMSYEQMMASPSSVLEKTLRFAGLYPDAAIVEESAKFASLGNLQQLEKIDYFGAPELRNESGDPRARKIRRGTAGGYRDYLSNSDLRFITEAETRIGNPFALSAKSVEVA